MNYYYTHCQCFVLSIDGIKDLNCDYDHKNIGSENGLENCVWSAYFNLQLLFNFNIYVLLPPLDFLCLWKNIVPLQIEVNTGDMLLWRLSL